MIEKKQRNIREIKTSTIFIPKKKKSEKFFLESVFNLKDFNLKNYTGHNMIMDFDIHYHRSCINVAFSIFRAREQIKNLRIIFSRILSRIKYIRLNLKYTIVDDSPRVMKFERYLNLSDFKDIIYDTRIMDYGFTLFSPENDILYDTVPDCDVKDVLVELYVGVID